MLLSSDSRYSNAIREGESTIADRLRGIAAERSDQPAIVAPGLGHLSFGDLIRHIDRIGIMLRDEGFTRASRVAVLIPGGPELALIDVAVACNAVAVPCNPSLPEREMRELFTRLRPEAVVLPVWQDPPNWLDTSGKELAVFRVAKLDRAPGDTLIESYTGSAAVRRTAGKSVDLDDPALILQTSGTAGPPKLVPVSHRNLMAMAARMEYLFELTPYDRCASLLPLYYAQGIKSSCFVPLLLGGSVALPEAPVLEHFEDWLSKLRPTWFPAGPTFLQAILDRLQNTSRPPLNHGLRFVTSGSAVLPERVRSGLRDALGVPVLDAYGLTETGLITGNAIRPDESKEGTVGSALPGEITIAGPDGRPLPAGMQTGSTGEVLLRGPSVLTSYVDGEEANRTAFVDGWFRTGDLGSIDAEGFLTITGRIKEIINRGGEKLSPGIIERAILQHPAVREAAAFSVPHPRLGEDVAAAIVLDPGSTVTARELQSFVRNALPYQMVPRSIFFVAALPKGPTGKVLRRTLTETCATSAGRVITVPETGIETQLIGLWRRLLHRNDIGAEDDFFEAGGDSLLAAHMLQEAEKITGRLLRHTTLPTPATIRALARSAMEAEPLGAQDLVVRLRGADSATPFFYFHGDYRFGGRYALRLAELMGDDHAFFVLNNEDVSKQDELSSIEEMVGPYLPGVLSAQPEGVLRLGGHCNGGLMALELARQLSNAGRKVELVVLIEPISLNALPVFCLARRCLDALLTPVGVLSKSLQNRTAEMRGDSMFFLWRTFRWIRERLGLNSPSEDDPALWTQESRQVQRIYQRIMASYLPPHISSRIVCLIAAGSSRAVEFDWRPWRRVSPAVTTQTVPGDHLSCLTTHVESLARSLREALSVQASSGPRPETIRRRG